MNSIRQWARTGLLTLVCCLPASGCWQTDYGIPAWQVVVVAAEMIPNAIWCAIVGCPTELIDGMVEVPFEEGLLTSVPVAIDVDELGRVYVAEGERMNQGGVEDNRSTPDGWLLDDLASHSVEDRRAYYEKWAQTEHFAEDHFTSKADRLIRLVDSDGNGLADRVDEVARFEDWTDGLIAGVLAHDGDIYVTEIPSVYRLTDPDGDGVVDRRETLSTGYGVKTSLVGHDMHGLVWGPDGKIYWSVGDRGYNVTTREGRHLIPTMGPGRGAVLRMDPDGSDVEVFATGVRNPQELAFDDYGNLFTGDNNGDGGDRARIVYLVDGGETGWAMPYQTLIDDYVRGPWNSERLWELQHEGQPAWVLPPVAYLAVGPAGFAAYPGAGLPERYRGHFFLCDYRYQAPMSGIWSFAVEPSGASFEVVDEHMFIGNLLATDVDFAYDGRMFVSQFDQFGGGQSIKVFRHEIAETDPDVAMVARLVREGMNERPADELSMWLGHVDRRIRLRAQFELARRGDATPFATLALDDAAPLLPRLHALWGLGQLGADALEGAGLGELLSSQDAPGELRAQLAKVAGDSGSTHFAQALIASLADAEPRIRFFSAQALGRLGTREAIGPLIALLAENADTDVYLRHAASFALFRIGDLDAVLQHADSESASVRLGVLLALRHAQDPRIQHFLEDPDPFVVLEAARAIHDLPITEALPALARFSLERLPSDDDPQSSYALHRRVIDANRTVGSEQAAIALAAHAADERHPEPMRRLALEGLAEFTAPTPREWVMGFHRPLPERPVETVYAALDQFGTALVDGDLGSRALEVALAYGRVPLDDDELAARVADTGLAPDRRVASLRALASRPEAEELPATLANALHSEAPLLRSASRDVLAQHDPGAALESVRNVPDDAPLRERQRAYETAGSLPGAETDTYLAAAVARVAAGSLDGGIALDVLEAAKQREAPNVQEALAAWEAHISDKDPVAARPWALAGGQAERGRSVFQGAGDCQRCHSGGGHGGQAGPELKGIGGRRGSEHILRSVLEPQAEIAEGFATVVVTHRDGTIATGTLLKAEAGKLRLRTGDGSTLEFDEDEIAQQTHPASGMPPMGLVLKPTELRDLIAYVMTL
ncbi:MAG: c-type cytochrome [bacterium]|nr:c-type cytochrome [bacterium]MCP5070938.1 c-type cytochrome [bacterium]